MSPTGYRPRHDIGPWLHPTSGSANLVLSSSGRIAIPKPQMDPRTILQTIFHTPVHTRQPNFPFRPRRKTSPEANHHQPRPLGEIDLVSGSNCAFCTNWRTASRLHLDHHTPSPFPVSPMLNSSCPFFRGIRNKVQGTRTFSPAFCFCFAFRPSLLDPAGARTRSLGRGGLEANFVAHEASEWVTAEYRHVTLSLGTLGLHGSQGSSCMSRWGPSLPCAMQCRRQAAHWRRFLPFARRPTLRIPHSIDPPQSEVASGPGYLLFPKLNKKRKGIFDCFN